MMMNTGYLSLRRRRRRKRTQRRSAALILCILGLLSLLYIITHADKNTEPVADESRIITVECRKAVLRGVDGKTARALSDILTKQLGKPYEYGAAGPDAFDCSGFVQYVYASMDIELPRVVRGAGEGRDGYPGG